MFYDIETNGDSHLCYSEKVAIFLEYDKTQIDLQKISDNDTTNYRRNCGIPYRLQESDNHNGSQTSRKINTAAQLIGSEKRCTMAQR